MEKTLTQREFAQMAGISTVTVSNLVKTGGIRKAEDGRIPTSEVLRYFEGVIKKTVAGSYLLLCAEDTQDAVDDLCDRFESSVSDGDNTPRLFDSVGAIIDAARASKEANAGSNEEKALIIQEKYNIAVLDAFMKQYLDKAGSYLASLILNHRYESFSKLPSWVAGEIVVYGRVITGDDTYTSSLSDCLLAITQYMDDAFESLMINLKLIGDKGRPLFPRSALSPEFFKKAGMLYNSFFYEMKDGVQGSKNIMFLKANEKIMKPLMVRAESGSIKGNIESVLENGFYMLANLDEGVAQDSLAATICGGLYKTVILCMSQEDYDSKVPDVLKTALVLAEKNGSIRIEQLSGY